MFQKTLDEGEAGDNVGLPLRGGVKKDEVERGQVLAKPGTITPHTKFEAEVYILSKDEGGRHTPFFSGYRPQFYFRTTDVTGIGDARLGGAEMCMPGDNVKHGSRADHAGRHGPAAPLRHPRGRPHGGCRRRDEGRRIARSTEPAPWRMGGRRTRPLSVDSLNLAVGASDGPSQLAGGSVDRPGRECSLRTTR